MTTILEPQTQKISLELPTQLFTATKHIAENDMISLSAVVRQSLQELVKNRND